MSPHTDSAAPPPTTAAELLAGTTATEILDFIAAIVGSLAWPVTVLGLLFLFRKAILKLLESFKERMPSIERVKTPWLEAAWSASAVEEVASEVGTTLPEPPDRAGPPEDIAVSLAHLKPSAGVVDAFTDVERQIKRYLASLDLPPKGSPVHMFARDSRSPKHLKHLVRELAQLRNAAAHGHGDISESSAIAYISSARRVANEIKTLADSIDHPETH